jgi:choloylglycine hydrolase
MVRVAGIATLIAAFTIATTPASACTGISLMAEDGAAIRGRTLEFFRCARTCWWFQPARS